MAWPPPQAYWDWPSPSVNAWINDANEALKIGAMLGQKIVLVATSTGASVATWAAVQKNDPQLAALILISPNYGLADPKGEMLAWPWGGQLAELILGPKRSWQPKSPAEAQYWTHSYPTRSLLAMMGAVELTRQVNYQQFKTPIQLIYSPRDQVVSASASERTFAQMASAHKEL